MESIGNKHIFDKQAFYTITYREWLIGMIASGVNITTAPANYMEINATWIIEFADKIIEALDKENK